MDDSRTDSHSSPNQVDQTYTPSQVARIMQKSDRWVLRELAEGRLDGKQTETGRWKIRASSVYERLERERLELERQQAEVGHMSYFEKGAWLAQHSAPGDKKPEKAGPGTDRIRELESQIADLNYRLGRSEASNELLKDALDRERARADRLEEELKAERFHRS